MQSFTTRPEILGTFGTVTSTHWLASACGMAILERGGNAFDAAVATAMTLQVVEPHLNGPGGESPVIFAPAGGDVRVLCSQGVAPRKAELATYLGLDLSIVPGSGMLAAVVPGAFDGWMLLLRDYGTLSLREVFEHAIGYATNGYPLVPNISKTIASVADLFRNEWTSSAAIYLPNDSVPAIGTIFANPQLAQTWQRLITEAESTSTDREQQIERARHIWSQGFIAEAIDNFCRTEEVMDTTGRCHKALLDGDDLAAWHASYEAPTTYDYHGYQVCKTGPWGQGPVFLQQLALLKHFDIGSLNPLSPEFVHLLTESAKLAFADREAFYGDPAFVNVPLQTLLSKDYNATRSKLITDTASLDIRPGTLNGYDTSVVIRHKGTSQEAKDNPSAGEPTVARFDHISLDENGRTSGDTCHFDIIDRWGNMVSATPSGGWLQSSPTIPTLGFCLGNRAQMFWLDARSPACIAPKKLPRTTLTPSIALRDGVPYMAFGTPGGDQQDQWSLHFFLRHIHFGMNLQQAIDAPGFHTNHFPSSFFPRECDLGHMAIEGRFPQKTLDQLAKRGHRLSIEDDWSLGRMTAASRTGSLIRSAANPRFMQGYAIGR